MTDYENVALLALVAAGYVRHDHFGVEWFGYEVSPVGGTADGRRLLDRLTALGYAELIPPFRFDRGEHGWRCTDAGHRKAHEVAMFAGSHAQEKP